MARWLPSLRGRKAGWLPNGADPETKELLTQYFGSLAAYGHFADGGRRSWPFERAVREGWERLIWVNRPVQVLAGCIAAPDKLPFRAREGDTGPDVKDHPLYERLNGQANPIEDATAFRHRLATQILLSKKGAFVHVTKSRRGTPLRYDLLPPGRTHLIPGTGEDPIDRVEVITRAGKTVTFPWDEIRWFRFPHPADPYSGWTPLEAAGLTVELHYYAILFNLAFFRNDGRPGGLVAVKGNVQGNNLKRVESRLQGGPGNAGKIAAITADGIDYVDLAAKPRDAQYVQTLQVSKTDLLSAFGVPESMAGNSADRTYANAEADERHMWRMSVVPLAAIMAAGFAPDLGDAGLRGYFDTAKIAVLHIEEKQDREEARTEVQQALITIGEYRRRAGHPPLHTPYEDMLLVPAGVTMVPTTAAAAALVAGQQQQPAAPGGTTTDRAGGAGPGDAGEVTGPVTPAAPAAPTPPPVPAVASVPAPVATPTAPVAATTPVGDTGVKRLRLVHSAPTGPGPVSGAGPVSDSDAREVARLDDALSAALSALAVQWVERAATKIGGAKARRGTRHWAPEPGYSQDTRAGGKALDPAVAVDEGRWAAEAEDQARPLVNAAAAAAAAAAVSELGADQQDQEGGLVAAVKVAAGLAAADVVAHVAAAASHQATKMAGLINAADQAGQAMPEIVAAVRQFGTTLAGWARQVAATAAVAAVEGARDAAARTVEDRLGWLIWRQWRSKQDDRVRPAHRAADGQKRPAGQPFAVGDALLRYPGDPAGPPDETINCRCSLRLAVRPLTRQRSATS